MVKFGPVGKYILLVNIMNQCNNIILISSISYYTYLQLPSYNLSVDLSEYRHTKMFAIRVYMKGGVRI